MDNFNLQQLINLFSQEKVTNLFFKSFVIIFSLMYLVYSLVIYKQTQVMLKTISGKNYKLILVISGIQVVIAIFLVLLSIFI